jgi:plasmid segregation protein ParM
VKRDLESKRVGVRAIDVGYSRVKFTLGREEANGRSTILTSMFPSVAALQSGDSGSQKIEGSTSQKGLVVTVDRQNYYVGDDVQLHCAGVQPRSMDEKYSTTPQYMALMYGALDEIAKSAGDPAQLVIENLVLGLPLSTCAKYAPALKEKVLGEHRIGENDGPRRTVSVENVHVIPQPHGALLNYGYARKTQVDGWVLVVDPGGGTLDWYLASAKGPAWGRSGAYAKAMLACAYAIADQIPDTKRDDINVVLRIEEALSGSKPTFRVNGQDYEIEGFQPAIDAVLQETYTKMKDRVGTWSDIDHIVLTGGGANQLGAFMRRAEPALERRIVTDGSPVFSNVTGFQIYGERLRTRAGVA